MSFILKYFSSVRVRIVLLAGLFAAISAASVFWLVIKGDDEIATESASKAMKAQTDVIAIRLEEDFLKMVQDGRLVSLTPPIQGLIRAQANNGVDVLEGSTGEAWRSRLETIFESVMQVRPDYSQIRYIGLADNGRELVRVDRVGNSVVRIPPAKLQQKGNEPYMQALPKIRYDEAWFAPISLNREFGEVEPNNRPMLRLVLPVYDEAGIEFGAIVINAEFDRMLQVALERIQPEFDTLVVTHTGDLFEFRSRTGASNFHLNDDLTKEELTAVGFANRIYSDEFHRYGGNRYFHAPLKVFGNAKGLTLDVILRVPESEFQSQIRGMHSQSAIFLIPLLCFCFGVLIFIVGRMIKPLQDMVDRIRLYTEWGNHGDLNLPTKDVSEVGDLARSFTDLVSQLQESRSETESIVRNAVYGVLVIDKHGVIRVFNPACERIFGYSAQETLGENINMLMPESYRVQHDKILKHYDFSRNAKIMADGRELHARRKSGEEFVVEVSVSNMGEGKNQLYCGLVRDMTDELANRDALFKHQQTLELVLDSGELGFWDVNLLTSEDRVSERYASMLGFSLSDYKRRSLTWSEFIHEDDREKVEDVRREYLAGVTDRYEVEFRMRHRDGHWIWVQSKAKAVERDREGKPTRLVGTHLDITDRKRHELALTDQNRKLELAETVAELGHWSMERTTQKLYWSEGIFRIHGLDPEWGPPPVSEAIDYYHPDDREIVRTSVQRALETGKPFVFQLRIIRADGELRHVFSRGEVLFEGNDLDKQMVFGIMQDVTDKVESENRLLASETKTKLLLSNMVDGVLTMDEEGVIDSCNPACAQLFGYEQSEMVGLSMQALVPSEDVDRHRRNLDEYLRTGMSARLGRTLEIQGMRKSGEIFTMEIAMSSIDVDGKKFFTGILRDITERKRMEIMKNEFVSTVNHELRTPLTSIYGSLDLLKKMSGPDMDEESYELISLAHDSCGRLTALVNDILDIEKIAAGKIDYHMEPTEFRTLVDDVVRRHISLAQKYNVLFETAHEIDNQQVWLDPSRFNQALVNLLSNACKFSPEGEQILIKTSLLREGVLRVTVTDHGPGIPEAFRSRIFDRFSQADGTTTRRTAGTGLGLNITKSIIEAFNGEVSFETAMGKGTSFHFDLPLHEAVEDVLRSDERIGA